jgi:hypothetical protein
MPGLQDVAEWAARVPVVATTDPLHHGAGYRTPEAVRRSDRDPKTREWAHACIERQLDLLCHGNWSEFARLAAEVWSDFRDAGPVLAHVLRQRAAPRGEVRELYLVDYAEALDAPRPTWVAAPLMRLAPAA